MSEQPMWLFEVIFDVITSALLGTKKPWRNLLIFLGAVILIALVLVVAIKASESQ